MLGTHQACGARLHRLCRVFHSEASLSLLLDCLTSRHQRGPRIYGAPVASPTSSPAAVVPPPSGLSCLISGNQGTDAYSFVSLVVSSFKLNLVKWRLPSLAGPSSGALRALSGCAGLGWGQRLQFVGWPAPCWKLGVVSVPSEAVLVWHEGSKELLGH